MFNGNEPFSKSLARGKMIYENLFLQANRLAYELRERQERQPNYQITCPLKPISHI